MWQLLRTKYHVLARRSCLAYTMVKPLERDLTEFVDNWNAHLIRRNRLADCPSGTPKELYNYSSLHGTQDYSKSINSYVWMNAMINESEAPGMFYSNEFKEWADYVIQEDFNMDQDCITLRNCRDLYLHLLSISQSSDSDSS